MFKTFLLWPRPDGARPHPGGYRRVGVADVTRIDHALARSASGGGAARRHRPATLAGVRAGFATTSHSSLIVPPQGRSRVPEPAGWPGGRGSTGWPAGVPRPSPHRRGQAPGQRRCGTVDAGPRRRTQCSRWRRVRLQRAVRLLRRCRRGARHAPRLNSRSSTRPKFPTPIPAANARPPTVRHPWPCPWTHQPPRPTLAWSAAVALAALIALWQYRRTAAPAGHRHHVPDDSIGTVTRFFKLLGSHRELPPGRIVALQGEPACRLARSPRACTSLLAEVPGGPGQVHGHPPTTPSASSAGLCGAPLPDGACWPTRGLVILQERAPFPAQRPARPADERSRLAAGASTPCCSRSAWSRMTVIEPGKMGVVEARDGEPHLATRVIGRAPWAATPSRTSRLRSAGQRGPADECRAAGQVPDQPALFKVTQVPVLDVPDNKVGIVTTRGAPLATGEIAGPEVEGNLCSRPASLRQRGRHQGLQEQVLLAGPLLHQPDVRHGRDRGHDRGAIARSAWGGLRGPRRVRTSRAPRLPPRQHGPQRAKRRVGGCARSGKYAINPYTHKIRIVPTANVVLNWATGKTGGAQAGRQPLDHRCAQRRRFHLQPRREPDHPHPAQRRAQGDRASGSMEALVTQVLEPTIGNYFRNAAQNSDVIDFLRRATQAGRGGHRPAPAKAP